MEGSYNPSLLACAVKYCCRPGTVFFTAKQMGHIKTVSRRVSHAAWIPLPPCTSPHTDSQAKGVRYAASEEPCLMLMRMAPDFKIGTVSFKLDNNHFCNSANVCGNGLWTVYTGTLAQKLFPKCAKKTPSLSITTGAETAWISEQKLEKESGGLFRNKADILGFQQQEAYVCKEVCSPSFYFYFCSSV